MSRRDTIIIAVLINACLLIVLFATAITKKEEPLYQIQQNPLAQVGPSSVPVEDVERPYDRENTYKPVAVPLTKPTLPSKPVQVAAAPAAPVTPKVEVAPPKPQPPAPKKEEVPAHFKITVKRGDYLDKIAKENNTRVDDIMKINKLANTQLRIGQTLLIPASGKEPQAKTAKANAPKQYVVKSGDTLWKIAKNHNMQVSELLKMNHMSSDHANRLQPGDSLLVR